MQILDLLNAREPLSKLASQSVNAIVAFRLAKIIRQVDAELAKFDELRSDLIKKYGVVDQSTGQVSITKEHIDIINRELNPVLLETVEIKFNPINLSQLESVNLSAAEMLMLEPFVAE